MKIAIRVKPVMVFFIYVPILLTLLSLVGQYSKYSWAIRIPWPS